MTEEGPMAGLEVWGPQARENVELVDDRYSIGKADDMDIVVAGDGSVSAVHATIERIGRRWFVRDLHSRNGTFVNGDRLLGERPLRDRDEIVLGKTRMVFFAHGVGHDPTTDVLATPPDLTPRQRDVLVELCRPVLSGNMFTQPAAVRDIAAALVVTVADVRQHLARLYDKFDIQADGNDRRTRLANEAVQRGAVSMQDIKHRNEH